jgi:hypothetical protein
MNKTKALVDETIDRLSMSIQENTRFSAKENERFQTRLKQIETQQKVMESQMIKEHDLEDMMTIRLLDMQKDFVSQELFKQQTATLTKRISALEFDLQAAELNSKETDQIGLKSFKEKVEKEIKAATQRRITDVEQENSRHEQ